MLGGLLAPLRLPERVVETLDSVAGAARELSPMREELTRVRKQTEPLAGLMPAGEQIIKQTEMVPDVWRTVERISGQAEPLSRLLPALDQLEQRLGSGLDSLHETIVTLEGEESHLNKRVSELVDELHAMHNTIAGLQDDVQRVTDRLPDSGARGPLETARKVLTGSGD